MPDTSLAFRVDRLWPDPAAALPLDEAFADLRLSPAPPGRPLVGLNMVTSIDGRAQRDGSAEGLAGRADRRLMRLIRAAHDAVASGAGTLRAAGLWLSLPADVAEQRRLAGRPPQPLQVLVAGGGELPLDAAWFTRDAPRLAIVGAGSPHVLPGAPPLPGATELVVAPTPLPEPRWICALLHERGVASLLLEGGPRLNAAFLAAGCLDELYWTVGAELVGGTALPMIAATELRPPAPGGAQPGRLVSVHRSGDDLFLRYRFGT